MAFKFEMSEIFNEPVEKLCENLLANLSKEDSGLFDTYWEALHADELTGENPVRLIWGVTNAFYPYEHGLFHFLVKFAALSANGCRVDFVTVLPIPAFEGESEAVKQWVRSDEGNMRKLAEKVMEFCLNPQAETNVGLINRFRQLLEGSQKDKRKSGEDETHANH